MAPPSALEDVTNIGNGTNGNGVHGLAKNRHGPIHWDADFTDSVIKATGPHAHPRLAEVWPIVVRHLHAIVREAKVTTSELMMTIDLIHEAARMSDDKRNETQLVSDILGLESLVDESTSKRLATSTQETSSAILGPFYRSDAPVLPNGTSILNNLSPATPWYEQAIADSALVSGRVLSAATGDPIEGAEVDVWETAPNGRYEQQDGAQPEMNLRGRFRTDRDGRYAFYGLRPTSYPIPDDGPAGRLLGLLDRHPHRPGHIHFIVTAPGHRALTTQVFDSRDQFLRNDAVFAVKDDLIIHFCERVGDDRAKWELEYDFLLGLEKPKA